MIEWAKREFALSLPSAKGSEITLRQQLLDVEKQTKGKLRDPRLDTGKCPDAYVYIWNWFLEIGTEFTWTELAAWAKLTNRKPKRYELKLLLRLNNARIETK